MFILLFTATLRNHKILKYYYAQEVIKRTKFDNVMLRLNNVVS